MDRMFSGASAFDQDLGWCVADEVDLNYAFAGAPCASTSCGVVQVADVADCPTPARKYPRRDDWLIGTATAASWWETSEGRLESPNPFVSEKDARRTART